MPLIFFSNFPLADGTASTGCRAGVMASTRPPLAPLPNAGKANVRSAPAPEPNGDAAADQRAKAFYHPSPPRKGGSMDDALIAGGHVSSPGRRRKHAGGAGAGAGDSLGSPGASFRHGLLPHAHVVGHAAVPEDPERAADARSPDDSLFDVSSASSEGSGETDRDADELADASFHTDAGHPWGPGGGIGADHHRHRHRHHPAHPHPHQPPHPHQAPRQARGGGATSPGSTLAKYIQRFRHAPPLSRDARDRLRAARLDDQSDFWWLKQHPATPTAASPSHATYTQPHTPPR